MKALDKLDYIERAKLLHNLFPNEIPAFLEFTLAAAGETVASLPAWNRQDRVSINSPEYWCYLAGNINTVIKANKLLLTKDSKRFSESLFAGTDALFMVHCLQRYTSQLDTKFKTAVDLFFADDSEKQ